jgi:hypothetical protein
MARSPDLLYPRHIREIRVRFFLLHPITHCEAGRRLNLNNVFWELDEHPEVLVEGKQRNDRIQQVVLCIPLMLDYAAFTSTLLAFTPFALGSVT